MTLSLSKKNVHSLIAMTLAMVSMISPADAQTSSTTCTSSSPQCCWVKRSWQLMGKDNLVDPTHRTACCYYLVSSTGTTTTQRSGISGVSCTSTGIVTRIRWGSNGLKGSIPTELANLRDLELL
jgi:hypothetical protein